jgi:hypothetical protein
MPRDGSGIYTKPFPDVVSGTTIESAVHNGIMADVAADLNAPRPVVAGGTGANSAQTARFNLAAEAAAQVVTNYDSHMWLPGSFRSAAGATGAPNAHAFAGYCYIGEPLANPPTNANVVIEARDAGDTTVPGRLYVREKKAGTWGAWTEQANGITDLDTRYVNITGDTMTGDLTISKNAPIITLSGASPIVVLDTPATTEQTAILAKKGGLNRWGMALGNTAVEGGTSTGSDFTIVRYNNAGAVIDVPLSILRANGSVYHQLGTDWGSGPMRLRLVGSNLVWDKNLDNSNRQFWDTGNSPAAGVSNGYQKFGSGIIMQWGTVSGGGGIDPSVNFPTGFTNACLAVYVTMVNSPALPATTMLSVNVVSFNNGGFACSPRYVTGGTVGIATQPFNWFAVGW